MNINKVETERMRWGREHARKMWNGQSDSLPARERLSRITAALAGFKYEVVEIESILKGFRG